MSRQARILLISTAALLLFAAGLLWFTAWRPILVPVTVIVIASTVIAVLIGLREAADPEHSRRADLEPWEREVVGEERSRARAERRWLRRRSARKRDTRSRRAPADTTSSSIAR